MWFFENVCGYVRTTVDIVPTNNLLNRSYNTSRYL